MSQSKVLREHKSQCIKVNGNKINHKIVIDFDIQLNIIQWLFLLFFLVIIKAKLLLWNIKGKQKKKPLV